MRTYNSFFFSFLHLNVKVRKQYLCIYIFSLSLLNLCAVPISNNLVLLYLVYFFYFFCIQIYMLEVVAIKKQQQQPCIGGNIM